MNENNRNRGQNQNRGQDNNHNQGNGKNSNRRLVLICLVTALVLFLMYSYVSSQMEAATNREISYTKFKQMVMDGQVKKLTLTSTRIVIEPKEGVTVEEKDPQTQEFDTMLGEAGMEIRYYTGYISGDINLYEWLDEQGVEYTKEVAESNPFTDFLLVTVLPLVLLWGVMYFLMRSISKNSALGGMGKSTAKMYMEQETGVTFADVAGQDEAKESLTELVDFLHNPEKYVRIGAKLPKGALLVGPPGTGKTLLAKAVAGEAKVPFFSISGSGFVEMFVGMGASRVRGLFKDAQSHAPCIIFIDEVDAIGKSRDSQFGNDEREQTLNQLLSEMDGFDASKGVVILAATNRPEVLDKALLRPGRFDRRIIVDKPDLKGRVDILKVHARDVLMHDSVDLDAIGLATAGAVGSDLANIINEAAILAVKKGRTVVTQDDLLESVEMVIAGKEKRDRILSPEEKRVVACHEVGHALITALKKNAEPVQKITIVPRTMGSLGYVMQVPEEERYLMNKDELLTRLVTLFGGRAAEEVVFGSVTTGAANDIQQATQLARAMITQYGMSDKFGLVSLGNVENRYLDGRMVMDCGDQTASEVDQEIMDLLHKCYQEALQLISAHVDTLKHIADFLVEKETITGQKFMEIYYQYEPEALEKAKDEGKVLIDNTGKALIVDSTMKVLQESGKAQTEAQDTQAETKESSSHAPHVGHHHE